MPTARQLGEAFGRNVIILKQQAAGPSHADSLLPPPVRGNCLNWVLGHLVDNRNTILRFRGEEPALVPDLIARYRRESEPITADAEGTLQLPELLAALERAQERLGARLATITGEELAREQTIGQRTTTLGQRLFFLYFHETYHTETYHTGQTELLRQLAGTNDTVI